VHFTRIIQNFVIVCGLSLVSAKRELTNRIDQVTELFKCVNPLSV